MARLTITCSSRYGRVSSCFTVRQAWRRKKIAAEKALSWALAPTGNGLRVSNASARYITIDSITLNGQKHAAGMVAPFSSLEIAPKGVALRTLPAKFSFTTINDYGAVVNHNYPQ